MAWDPELERRIDEGNNAAHVAGLNFFGFALIILSCIGLLLTFVKMATFQLTFGVIFLACCLCIGILFASISRDS